MISAFVFEIFTIVQFFSKLAYTIYCKLKLKMIIGKHLKTELLYGTHIQR